MELRAEVDFQNPPMAPNVLYGQVMLSTQSQILYFGMLGKPSFCTSKTILSFTFLPRLNVSKERGNNNDISLKEVAYISF